MKQYEVFDILRGVGNEKVKELLQVLNDFEKEVKTNKIQINIFSETITKSNIENGIIKTFYDGVVDEYKLEIIDVNGESCLSTYLFNMKNVVIKHFDEVNKYSINYKTLKEITISIHIEF